MSGVVEDLFDLMNVDCWREVLDHLPNPKDIISLAAASPDLEDLLDETDELTVALAVEAFAVIHRDNTKARIRALVQLRPLSRSRSVKSMIDSQLEACISHKYHVEPMNCYIFNAENISRFIHYFEEHWKNPFAIPACHFDVISDLAMNLLSQHGRYIRQLSIYVDSTESKLLEKLAGMLSHLPNVERLSVYENGRADNLTAEPHPSPFPCCPKLTQLRLTMGQRMRTVAPLFCNLIRRYGSQLTRLSVDTDLFSVPELTQDDWNALANLQRLEIRLVCNSQRNLLKINETLSLVPWKDLKELYGLPISFAGESVLPACLQCLQNFHATLETVMLDTSGRHLLSFDEQAAAAHATCPNLVELGLFMGGMFPLPKFLRRYFTKVFPNLKKLLVLGGHVYDRETWSNEDFYPYFQEFPNLEEIKLMSPAIVFKRQTRPPSQAAHLSFWFESDGKVIVESLSHKLSYLSHIEKLTVETRYDNIRRLDIEHADILVLPPCPRLTLLDLTKLSADHFIDYQRRREFFRPIVSSLFTFYWHQLTELSVSDQAFYADVNLETWKTLTNLQVFRISLSKAEWGFAYAILSRVEWPQLRELSIETDVPFGLDLLRMLGNFKDSLETLRVAKWADVCGPRVWIDKHVQVLHRLTNLTISQRLAGDRKKKELWSALSRVVPSLKELDFVKFKYDVIRLKEEDVQYFAEFFRTLNMITLVDEEGQLLDAW